MRAVVLVIPVLMGGCFYEWGSASDIPDPSSPDGGGGDSSGPKSPGDGGTSSDVSPPPPPPPPCTSSSACESGSFCDFSDGACGKKGAGVCTPVPTTCRFGMFCTCDDGTKYTSDCAAAKDGIDTASAPMFCAVAPSLTFRCGDEFCKNGYLCAVDGASTKEPSLCLDSSSCATPDCQCPVLAKYIARGCACDSASGHTVVKCP